MHYKNGREAKVGDHVVYKGDSGHVKAGIVVSATPESDSCNLRVTPITLADYVTASQCVHIDDAIAAPRQV